MPLYEYFCDQCGLKFEELVARHEGTETMKCRGCKNEKATRMISAASFQLNGEGFHRNDYPTVDQAVGASSESRWKEIHERRAVKDKLREESGTGALAVDSDGNYSVADSSVVEARNKMGDDFSSTLTTHREERVKSGKPQSTSMQPE